MRCRIARKTLLDVELSLARPETGRALEAHLAGCADCAALASRERDLTADLAALRGELPFPVDVTARVAARLSTLPPHAHADIGLRQFGWAVTAAVIFAVTLLAGLGRAAPDLPGLFTEGRTFLAGLWLATSGLATPAAALATTLARAFGDLAASLAPAARTLKSLQPVALVTVAACTAMMLSSIVLVVGRDFMRPRWTREET